METLFKQERLPTTTPKGIFLLLHGMESHSGWFEPLLPQLTNAGYATLTYDRPGWGRSAGTRGHLESYKDFLETLSSIASEARQRFGKVHLAGMSWGGMAALYAALRRSWLFDSVTLIAPGLAARTDLPFLAKLQATGSVLTKNFKACIDTAFKPEHFTADMEWLNFIRTDPHLVTQVSAGFCFETTKMRSFIKQTAGKRTLPPLACLLAGNDDIVDNHKTTELCQRAGAVIQTLPNCRHTLVFENTGAVAAALLQQAERAAASHSPGHVWVAGAGAIGGLTAALLSFGHVDATALVKEKYEDGFRSNGVRLMAGEGQRTTETLSFASHPSRLPANLELLIIAVKSFDTDSLLDSFANYISPNTVIASLQNGLGNEAKIAAAFPNNTIVAASICASVEMDAPGKVLWPDDRGGVAAAVYRGDADRAKKIWKSMLGRTGMECGWVEGANAAARLKWSKLMLNTGFNALNSMTGLPSGQIMTDPVYGKVVIAALREGFACMDRLGLPPVDLPGYPVSKLRTLLKSPDLFARKAMAWQASRSTEASFSMRQDVLKNRPHTEIGELNGIIVETGKTLDLPTPANSWLVEQVKKRQ